VKVAHVCIYDVDSDAYKNRLLTGDPSFLFDTPVAITSADQIPVQMAQVREAIGLGAIEFRHFTADEVNAGELGEWLKRGA
jgi:hypothetical protein